MMYKKCRLYRLIGPAGAVSEKKLLYSDYFQKEDMENLPDFTRTAEPWAVWHGFPSNCRKISPQHIRRRALADGDFRLLRNLCPPFSGTATVGGFKRPLRP
ncbi:MAG: hypothetical protein KA113_15255 [Syntrophaceae bacterium]|jgi:hypothetical protein|nr:hypothetical protein [Syntrophaceae bacterium]